MDGWMDGRTDGWMDGCCVDKAGRGAGGGRSAFRAMQTKYRQHLGKNRVAWCRLLGLLVACLFDGWMDGWSVDNGGRGWMHKWMEWSVNKGGRGCGGGRSASPAMRTKYRQHVGSHRVVSFWLLGLLVAWWATNAKQVSTAFGGNVWLLGLFAAGGLPTLSF